MDRWAIYDRATGAWEGEPADDAAHDPETQGAEPVPASWPALATWSPGLRTFVARERVISPIAFVNRFSAAEEELIDASPDPAVRRILRRLQAAAEVNLDHPDTIAGVGYFVQLGLISPERAAELLG